MRVLIISIFILAIYSPASAQHDFDRDSAYYFIKQQIAFGPRVPGTDGHSKCAQFFVDKFTDYQAKVVLQEFDAKLYNGQWVKLQNVIASYNPKASKRIILSAHWDTRPLADKDVLNKKTPIDGANDGASGPGILLEIARQLSSEPINPKLGVDIILFDGEDQGEPSGYKIEKTIENAGDIWWCLGSRYWAENPHQKNYKAKFGILLDMVGAPQATFYKEGGSMQFAAKYMNKVWRIARKNGFADYFKDKRVAGIMDDHIFVSKDANIPMLNIIHFDLDEKDNFPAYHHTQADNLQAISPRTLQVVGETILLVLMKYGL
jgi:glutaminyl-peptide cyclotransferase